MINLSVLILTYNSQNHITNCLTSILECAGLQLDSDEVEVIVHDNNSSDQTIDTVKKFIEKNHTKNIVISKSSDNVGFAKGINSATKKARGEYILFLNPDSELANDKIFEMTQLFDRDEKIAIVGGKITDYQNKPELSVGKFYELCNLIVMITGLEKAFGVRFSPKKITDVDFVSGGFMMVRVDYFEKLNGFDEKFFMYVEDMELCYRAKKMGFRVVFFPNAIIKHIGQASSSRAFAIMHIYKGLLYFYKKHKNQLEFLIAKSLLITKAKIAIMVGTLAHKPHLVEAYTNALQIT